MTVTAAPTTGVLAPTSRRRGRRALGSLALVPVLALVLAACGSGDDGPQVASAGNGSASAEDTPTLSAQDKAVKFASCMRDNGVDMPDPGENGGFAAAGTLSTTVGSDDAQAAQDAFDACKEFMPDLSDIPPMSAEDLEAMREYATCMRENGVDMPDPDPEGGGVTLAIDATDDTFTTAMEACADVMPNGNLQGVKAGS